MLEITIQTPDDKIVVKFDSKKIYDEPFMKLTDSSPDDFPDMIEFRHYVISKIEDENIKNFLEFIITSKSLVVMTQRNIKELVNIINNAPDSIASELKQFVKEYQEEIYSSNLIYFFEKN